MSANVSSPANFPKWPFWRVLEFDKFAGEWPLLKLTSTTVAENVDTEFKAL
jgi:hypothetical protein